MGGRIWLGWGRFDGDDFGGCVAAFFLCLYQMFDEAANGLNTGVCDRFGACGWGCVPLWWREGKGMGIKMALKRGWKSVGRRQKRRRWLRLIPPFSCVVGREGKGTILSWFWNWGYKRGYRKGLHLMEKGVTKSGNGGVDGEGVKVRIFFGSTPNFGQ